MRRDDTWTYPTRFTLEMSRAALRGGTLTPFYWTVSACQHDRGVDHCHVARLEGGHYWGKHYLGFTDSCAGDSSYCSFVTLKYDISCGGRLSSRMVER